MRWIILLLIVFIGFGGRVEAQGLNLSDGIQIIQTLADPAQYVQTFPETDRWIPWFSLRAREYKVPIFLYYFGIILMMIGVSIMVYQVFTGSRNLADLLTRSLVALTIWQLLVLTPSENGCTPESAQSTPCKVAIVDSLKDKSVLETNGTGYVVTTKSVTVKEPQAPDKPLATSIKSLFKDVSLSRANQLIIASLQNEGEGIKQVQQIIMNLSMISWTVSGAATLTDNAAFRCAAGFLGGLIGGQSLNSAATGCAVTAGGVPEMARNISQTMGTARSLLIMGPMLVIATYHAVNTIAGLYLYTILLFMPLLAPMVLLGGVVVMANVARHLLVAIMTPLISGLLLSAGMSLSFSFSQQHFQALEDMAKEVEKAGIPSGLGGFAIQNNTLASLQLYNLYQCLQAEDGGMQTASAICDQNVATAAPKEYNQLVAEEYSGQNLNAMTTTGYTVDTTVEGQAFRRTMERATPYFAVGGLWSSKSSQEKAAMRSELERLFQSGDAASLSSNVKAMLTFFQAHGAYPDLGTNPSYTVFVTSAAQGLLVNQASGVRDGFLKVAFDPNKLPPNGLLSAQDTWATGNSSLGLMNLLYAAEASDKNFRSALVSKLNNRMLSLVIVTLVAVGITVVLLSLVGQLLSAVFAVAIAAGSSGLQSFSGVGAAAGSVGALGVRLKDMGKVIDEVQGAGRAGGGGSSPSGPRNVSAPAQSPKAP